MTESIIIMAGGASSRMKRTQPGTKLNPEVEAQAKERHKSLIELGPAGKPFLDYLLSNIREAGYVKAYLTVGENAAIFRERYERFPGVDISFATQFVPSDRDKPWGTADAVFQTLEQFPHLQNESFAVCNGDNLYSVGALRTVRRQTAANACIAYDLEALAFSRERVARFSVAKFDEAYHLKEIIEKPSPDSLQDYADAQGTIRISMNLFCLSGPLIWPHLQDCPVHPARGEKELPTAVLAMLAEHPGCLTGIPLSEHVPDLTSQKDIQTLSGFFREKED